VALPRRLVFLLLDPPRVEALLREVADDDMEAQPLIVLDH
jgi:hypothetical protein